MLYLKFECSSCHTLFSYSGNDILNRSELSCPQCNLKLSSSVLKRLQSNIRFFEKSSTFSISITPSPSIKMGDMIQNARDHSANFIISALERKNDGSVSDTELNEFINSYETIINAGNTFTLAMFREYHHALYEILLKHGIDIGDFV